MKPVQYWQVDRPISPCFGEEADRIGHLPRNIKSLIGIAACRPLESHFPWLSAFLDEKEHSEGEISDRMHNTDLDEALGSIHTKLSSTLWYAIRALVRLEFPPITELSLTIFTQRNELVKKNLAFQNNYFLPLFVPLDNFSVTWRTSDVVALANTIYNEKRFDLCGILGDALLDAGCEDSDWHSVLKSPYLCRGCWVLEQLR
jgi:hypothetical protein